MMNMTKQKFTHPFKRSKILQGIKKIKALTKSLFIGLSETVKKLTEKMKTTLHKVLAKSNKQFLFFSQQRFYFDFPLSAKPLQSRMGKGKANIKEYIAPMTKSLETFFINPLKENAKLSKVLITKTIKQKVSYKLLKQFSYKNIENKKKVNLYSLFQQVVVDINSIMDQIADIVVPYFESKVYNEWYDPIIQELFSWIAETLMEYFKTPEVPNPKLKPITVAPEIAKELPIITRFLSKIYAFFNVIQVKINFYHYYYSISAYINENFFTGIFIDKYSTNFVEYLSIKEETRLYNLLLISSKICIILFLPLSIILSKKLKKAYKNNWKDKLDNLSVNLEEYVQLSENKWKKKYCTYNNIEKITELNKTNYTHLWFSCNLEIKELNKQINITKKEQENELEHFNEILKKYTKVVVFLKTPLEEISKNIVQSQLKNNFGQPIIMKEKVFCKYLSNVQKANKIQKKLKVQNQFLIFNLNQPEQRMENFLLKTNVDKYFTNYQVLNKVSELFLPYKKKIFISRNKKIQAWFDEYIKNTFNNDLLKEPLLASYYTALIMTSNSLFEEIKKQKNNEETIISEAKKERKNIITKEKLSYDIIKTIVDDSSKKELKEFVIKKLNTEFENIEKETHKKFEKIVDIAMANMLKKHIVITAKSTYTKNDLRYSKYIRDFSKLCEKGRKKEEEDEQKVYEEELEKENQENNEREKELNEKEEITLNNYYLCEFFLDLQDNFNIKKELKPNKQIKTLQENILIYIIKYPYLRASKDETFIEENFLYYMYSYFKQFMQNHYPHIMPEGPKYNIFEEIEIEKKQETFAKNKKILDKMTFYKTLLENENINEPKLQAITLNFVLKQQKYREKILSNMEKYFKISRTFNIEDYIFQYINKQLLNSYLNKHQEHSDILLKTMNKINDSYEFIINNVLKYNKDFLYILNNIKKSTLYEKMLNIELYKTSKILYKEKITKNQMATLTSAIIEHEKTRRQSNMLLLQAYALLLNKKNKNQENQLIENNRIINIFDDFNNWIIELNKKGNNIANKLNITEKNIKNIENKLNIAEKAIKNIENKLNSYDKKVKNEVETKIEFMNNVITYLEKDLEHQLKPYRGDISTKLQKLLKETTNVDITLKMTLKEIFVLKHNINYKELEIKKNITRSRKIVIEYQQEIVNKYLGVIQKKDPIIRLIRSTYDISAKISNYRYFYQMKLTNKLGFLGKMINKLYPLYITTNSFEEAIKKKFQQKANNIFKDKNNRLYIKDPLYISDLFMVRQLIEDVHNLQDEWYVNSLTTDLEEFYPFSLYSDNYFKMQYVEGLENFYKFPLTKHNYFFLDNGQKCHLINVTKHLVEKMTYSEIKRREKAWHLYRASTKQRNAYSLLFYHIDTRFGREFLEELEDFELIQPNNLLLPIFSFNGIHELFDVALLKLTKLEFREHVRYLSPDSIEMEPYEHYTYEEYDDEENVNFCSYALYESQGPFFYEGIYDINTKKEAQREYEEIQSYGDMYFWEHPFFDTTLKDRTILKMSYRRPPLEQQYLNQLAYEMTEYSIDQSVQLQASFQLEDCQDLVIEWLKNKPFGPLVNLNQKKPFFLSNEQCQKHVIKFTNVYYDRLKLDIVNERRRREKFPEDPMPKKITFDIRRYYKKKRNTNLKNKKLKIKKKKKTKK